MKRIINKIADSKIKCVSFDVFDTLIQRPTIVPEDVFTLVSSIVGESSFFYERRIAAQKRAFLLKDYYSEYITLDDIYREYQEMFSLSHEECEKIKKAEMEVEYNISFDRKSVKRIYQYARKKGKKIIICSDMYLPKALIEKMLIKNGYTGWDDILISCELNKTKRSGSLYDYMLSKFSVEGIYAENILHIGDNSTSDVEVPFSKGIKVVQVPSAISCFKKCSRLKNILEWNSPVYHGCQNLLLGLSACIMFDNPFQPFDKDSRFNGDARYLGIYLAPFVTSFTLWLIEQIENDEIDCMGMVWRDGFVPERIINKLTEYMNFELPNCEKFVINRSLRLGYTARKKGGLFDAVHQWKINPNMSIQEFANNIIGCSTENEREAVFQVFAENGYISKYDAIGEVSDYSWFIHELEGCYSQCKEAANIAFEQEIEKIKKGNKIGLFDIGYRGSVSRFLKENFGISTTSYHMLGTFGSEEEIDGVKIKSFVKYGQNIVKNTKGTLHKFMELIISEQEPSVMSLHFDNGNLVYDIDELFDFCPEILTVQQGIFEYVESFAKILGIYARNLDIDQYMIFTMVVSILSKPSKKDASFIRKLEFTSSHYAEKQDDFSRWYEIFFGGK